MTVSRLIPRFLGLMAAVLGVAGLAATPATAEYKQYLFPDPASTVAEDMVAYHNILMYVISAICILVLVLLAIVIFRFNKRANPTPATFSHNALIEVIWTAAPAITLVVLAIPSINLLYKQSEVPESELTIKAIGSQWFWDYEFDVNGETAYLSQTMLDEETAADEGLPWKLATDNPLVLPIDTNIRLQTTAGDVIHAWTIPAFGVKLDAIPGRLNETWFNITTPGTYYGQCSELCGKDHSYMPIMVKAVTREEYQRWLSEEAGEYVDASPETLKRVASAR